MKPDISKTCFTLGLREERQILLFFFLSSFAEARRTRKPALLMYSRLSQSTSTRVLSSFRNPPRVSSSFSAVLASKRPVIFTIFILPCFS